jgi:hypothetical protein
VANLFEVLIYIEESVYMMLVTLSTVQNKVFLSKDNGGNVAYKRMT